MKDIDVDMVVLVWPFLCSLIMSCWFLARDVIYTSRAYVSVRL